MKKKIIVSLILALGAQMPMMAMDQQQDQQNLNQFWGKVGLYAAGSALGSYGLYKGYNTWLTYKKPVMPPTLVEKLAAQVPGGNAVLSHAQKTASFAKKHSYITGALALAAVAGLGYKYILEPGMRADELKYYIKYYITGISNHDFAVQGPNVFAQVCAYIKQLATEFDDVELIENVNKFLTYYVNNTGINGPKDVKGLQALNKQLILKKAALFEKIDEVTCPS